MHPDTEHASVAFFQSGENAQNQFKEKLRLRESSS